MKLTSVVFLFLFNTCYAFDCKINQMFDYIIVGSGTTGSVVASRLSESSHISVLVLEAGEKPSLLSDIPFVSDKIVKTSMNWHYTTVPQKHCCDTLENRQIPLVAGRSVGGTGSLDFMLYTRGNQRDFDHWSSMGNPGWTYQQLLPYFFKLEDYQIPRKMEDDFYHREGGPMTISRPSFKSPLSDAFLEAGRELGYNLVDYNGKDQTGFMNPPLFLGDGVRRSSYDGYLKPVIGRRRNLQIITNVLVTKIIFDKDQKAIAVVFDKGDKNITCQINVRKEIILSAGVFNTPKLLLLSGVGPEKVLKRFKIPVVKNLAGVGRNYQDHVVVNGFMFYTNQSVSYNYKRFATEENFELWKKTKTGPLTSSGSYEGIAFYKSQYCNSSDDWPDIEILFKSDSMFKYDKTNLRSYVLGFLPDEIKDVITFQPILLRPKSRGYVTISSKEPKEPPLINPNYLSHPDDVTILVEGFKFAWKISQTSAFLRYGAQLFNIGIFPNCAIHIYKSPSYTKCIVKSLAYTAYNGVGTCKMGPNNDSMAVVDHTLRVHGIKNLRIADASIMPNIVSAHPSTTCIVIGEKLADLIKNNLIE